MAAAPRAGLAQGWALLEEAGDTIAILAGVTVDTPALTPRAFAMQVAAAGPMRLKLAEQAIDDCAAMLHWGLTALLRSSEAGHDAGAAAGTLWREYVRARHGLLALVSPAC